MATPAVTQFNDFLHATSQEEKSEPKMEVETPPSSGPASITIPGSIKGEGTEIAIVSSPVRPPVPHLRVESVPLCTYSASCTMSKKLIEDHQVDASDEGEKKYSETEVMELLRRQHSLLTRESDEHMHAVSGSSMKYFLKMTPLSDIHAHEEVLPDRTEQFHDFILSYGLNNPICIPAIIVDVNTNVIIDGHHRYYTLRRLGLQEVEMLFIDYMHQDILVESKANIGKDGIIEAALSGKLVRPKLTRHLVLQNGKYVPLLCISAIISFVLKIGIHQI